MKIPTIIVNSRVWHNLYYKHTKKHQAELKATRDRVLKRKEELIGK